MNPAIDWRGSYSPDCYARFYRGINGDVYGSARAKREIGILTALGASFGYILDLLFRETLVIALIGTGLGIAMTYGTQWLIMHAVPASLTQETAYKWWPIAGAISITGALLGADLSRMQRSETGRHPDIIV